MTGATSLRWPLGLLIFACMGSLLVGPALPASAHLLFRSAHAQPGEALQTRRQVLARAVQKAVNDFRASHQLPPLRLDIRLNEAAQAHTDFMAATQVITHFGSDGSDPGKRLERAGYRWSTIGENIAAGQIDAQEVVQDWINSPAHRANLLKEGLTDIGVGYNHDYWTLDMAG